MERGWGEVVSTLEKGGAEEGVWQGDVVKISHKKNSKKLANEKEIKNILYDQQSSKKRRRST